jgi:pimeloyl-ACP methyl ester carboxylesterase
VGTGAPVVVVHGTPGGIDAAALMAGFLPHDGIAAILLSRPGYLGTELGDRTTVDQQADLMAALLDHLGVERAGVFSWLGGGPAGYRLAVRHPDRVNALVAFAAVSQAYHLPKTDEEVFADPVKRDFVLVLGPTASQDKARRTGYANDLQQFAAITSTSRRQRAVSRAALGSERALHPAGRAESARETGPSRFRHWG